MLPGKREAGDAALRLMDGHLASRGFFVGERLSLADIALYAYTHVAEEGGFDLARYPAVGAWLARVVSSPGHVSMA
jgi:glutathione S-transferase